MIIIKYKVFYMKIKSTIIAFATASLLLGGCTTPKETHHVHEHASTHQEDAAEVKNLARYAVFTHDAGITTIDLSDGETVSEIALPGFKRLNQAGDNRHLLVSSEDEFIVYDSGLIAEAHDDHFHYYQKTPELTNTAYAAKKPGHVTVNAGYTVLFSDDEGSIQVLKTAEIAAKGAHIDKHMTADPHHGVAVKLSDGKLFTTQGTTESRNTLQVLDGEKVVAQTDNCPGSHGEATAKPNSAGDVLVIGCTNGPVVYKDGSFHKITAADEYARSGNLRGSDKSAVVLGDYKTDKNPDPKPERPTRVALIDTQNNKIQLVDLASSYWFRSLGRGPAGEGLVLTYDGNLQVINPDTGEVTAKVPTIAPWQEKSDWQEPGPILKIHGSWAYVTDATNKELVVIDLTSLEVTKRFSLAKAPGELEIVTGK